MDETGNVLGRHKGIMHYTVGQRKGLGIALGYPVYVKEIRPAKNEVVLSGEKSLYSRKLLCANVNFMSIAGLEKNEKIHCVVKIRYSHIPQPAEIELKTDNMIKISFENPVKAAALGQSAVFYDDEGCVIGGGIIAEVLSESED